MTLGKGMIYCALAIQKINTRSLTESELVGVNDAIVESTQDPLLCPNNKLTTGGSRGTSVKVEC
jgi:hypothetical protein